MQRDMFLAVVRAFPLARTVEVRRMAKFLTVCQGAFAEKYYREHCRDLAKRFRKAGVSEVEIRREIVSFQEAVQRQLENTARECESADNPRGAA